MITSEFLKVTKTRKNFILGSTLSISNILKYIATQQSRILLLCCKTRQ